MAKKKRKAVMMPAWHPDFRISETLPDVKVVRTDFIINFVAITAAVALAGFFGYRQVYTWDLKSRIADVEQQIQKFTPENRRDLKESGEFNKASKEILDLGEFYKQSSSPLEFIVEVSQTRPDYIALSDIEFAEVTRAVTKTKSVSYSRYTFRGMLAGSSAEALDALNKYREILRDLEFFKDKIDTIDVPPPRRNPKLDLFEFNIVVVLKPNE